MTLLGVKEESFPNWVTLAEPGDNDAFPQTTPEGHLGVDVPA